MSWKLFVRTLGSTINTPSLFCSSTLLLSNPSIILLVTSYSPPSPEKKKRFLTSNPNIMANLISRALPAEPRRNIYPTTANNQTVDSAVLTTWASCSAAWRPRTGTRGIDSWKPARTSRWSVLPRRTLPSRCAPTPIWMNYKMNYNMKYKMNYNMNNKINHKCEWHKQYAHRGRKNV